MVKPVEVAERQVEKVFVEEFPNANYLVWNTEIDERIAEGKIRAVGRASRIDVRMFIQDLW